jgi:membrane-bound lytic murein transglycosylase B
VSYPVPPTLDRPAPEPPPRRRLGWLILLVAALIAGVVVVVIGLDRSDPLSAPTPPPPGFTVPDLDVAPGAAVPTATAVASGAGAEDVAAWAERLSDKTEIPTRSLVAYAEAEIETKRVTPDCKINWATLAGVGRVESHHGRYNGTEIGANGVLTPPIIGIPLDGSPGVKAIPDTDGGRLDGDTQWDRAVGAMQFLPTTWAKWGARASGDGAPPDPQNIDDAALSAARYLCGSGGDMSSAQGWWLAVLTYNESTTYGKNVFSGADAYAKAAAKL